MVVTDTMHRRVETWIRRHIPDDAHCFVTDITGGIGLDEGTWEVDIAGKKYPAAVSLRPLYDPKMERIKA